MPVVGPMRRGSRGLVLPAGAVKELDGIAASALPAHVAQESLRRRLATARDRAARRAKLLGLDVKAGDEGA